MTSSDTNHPKVSIIVLNWNGLDDTIECLGSLKRITYPNYNVILVDNASTGNDVAVLREQFGDFIYIIPNDRNYGFAAGNNVGIRYALEKDADYVLLLNNDTTVDPAFLDELIKVAESNARIGILCPHIYSYDEPDRLAWTGGAQVDFWRSHVKRLPEHRYDIEQPVIETEVAIGTAMLITKKTIEAIGLLPEEYFFGVEDVDYSVHASRAGIGIAVIAKAKIWHKFSQSGKELNASLVRYQYNGWQILRRKYLPPHYRFLSTATSLIWAGRQLPAQFLHDVLHGNWHSVRMRCAMVREAIKGLLHHPRSRNQTRVS